MIGNFYREIREYKNLTQEQVAANVMTQRMLSHFEQDGEVPNRLVLERLMQRVGENAGYFMTVLSKEEYEYFWWRRDVLCAVMDGTIKKREKSLWRNAMARDRSLHEGLQEQFALFWRGYATDDIAMMQRAIARTVSGFLATARELGQELSGEYEQMLWALRFVKDEFDIRENPLENTETHNEIYLLDEVLKTYCAERKLSVREIGENACSAKTYRALEGGKRRAKHVTYDALADYLGIPFGEQGADIVTDSYGDILLTEKMKYAGQRQKYDEERRLLDELAERLGGLAELPVNRQFLRSSREIIDFLEGKISPEEYLEKVEAAIKITIPEWNADYGVHFYTRREMLMVYYEAIAYRRLKQPETAIRLLEKLWNTLLESLVDISYRHEETMLIFMLWKDVLTDMGRYEEALEKARQGMRYAFRFNRGDKLARLAFEPGWILERQVTSVPPEEKKRKCGKYFRAALLLGNLFEMENDVKTISGYVERKYDISDLFL